MLIEFIALFCLIFLYRIVLLDPSWNPAHGALRFSDSDSA